MTRYNNILLPETLQIEDRPAENNRSFQENLAPRREIKFTGKDIREGREENGKEVLGG